ncbi:MAG: winged helix-turn-helix domain-containing protein [Hydrogenophaga sp.]|nr:winged helix-turn-helix domain-containing protein [Hydrogenophaga sp.]
MEPVYRFAPFELRAASRQLVRDGEPLKLSSRALDLLTALVERRERVVTKGELLQIVWPRLVVEENNLQVHVMALRKLLGPDAIATVPGRGYRFTAPLEAELGTPAPVTKAAEPLASLIGREADIQALRSLVPLHGLVTLLGAGGVGKSSLAARVMPQCAPAFADGSAWVDLGPQTHARGVVDAIATATRLTLPRGDAHEALGRSLAASRLLLVLDNAEHLVDEVARVAKTLRQAAPGVHLLVTSQVPLRLRAEQVYRLEPLALPDPDAGVADASDSAAVQLFMARVRAGDRHFVLDSHNVRAAVSLARRLDGLPLAIEMAAARVPALTLTQLDAALGERFRLLTLGEPGAPARQHTLLAALQWTHGLLTTLEQAVFRRLAVFVGPFSLPTAQQVCHDDTIDAWQVLDALSVLVDRSLVAPPVGEPPRYRLLDTPHAFARQLLAASGEERATRERHVMAMRDVLAGIFESHLWARASASNLRAEAIAEADNGQAALEWALVNAPEQAVEMAPGLAQALVERHAARLAVWRSTQAHVHDHPSAGVRARWHLGWAQFWIAIGQSGTHDAALAAADVFHQDGHRAGEYRALAIAASVLSGQAQTDVNTLALERMEALEDPSWPADLRYLRQYARITHLNAQGRYDEALAVGEASIELTAGRGGRLQHDLLMMYLELMADRVSDAVQRGEAARARQPRVLAHTLATGVEILLLLGWLRRGDTARARELVPAVWTAAGAMRYQGPTAEVLALLAMRENRPRTACLLLGYAETAYVPEPMQRLPVFRWAGEQAQAWVTDILGPAVVAQWRVKGRTMTEAGIFTLAIALQDAQ